MLRQNPISGKFEPIPNPLGKVRSFRLPQNDDEKFMAIAEKLDISPSDLIRQIIKDWLDKQN